MKQDVFTSYNRKDSEMAERLTKVLDERRISYFIDRDGISGGEYFINVIAEQIQAYRTFLFIGSSHSYESKWTMKEVALAFQKKDLETIIPVIIDNEPMPNCLSFLFSNINILSQTEILLYRTAKALSVLLAKGIPIQTYVTGMIKKWKNQTQIM